MIRAGQGSRFRMLFKNHTPAAFKPMPIEIPKTYFSSRTLPSRLSECLKTQERCSKKATTEPTDLPRIVAQTGLNPKYVSATWNIPKSVEVATTEVEPYLPSNFAILPNRVSCRRRRNPPKLLIVNCSWPDFSSVGMTTGVENVCVLSCPRFKTGWCYKTKYRLAIWSKILA